MDQASERFDFGRPGLFGRDALRSLEVAHDLFPRLASSRWGAALRAVVQVEPLAVDQVAFDDYVRSLPTPGVLAVVAVPPLPGQVVVEIDPQLALGLVDRLLGGRAAAVLEPRRPTDLEAVLLKDLLGHIVAALSETLGVVPQLNAELVGLESNPQLLQILAPSDLVVAFTYRVRGSQGVRSEGLLTVCYPAATLAPVLEQLTRQRGSEPSAVARPEPALLAQLEEVAVSLAVRLRDCRVAAAELADLRVGDVVRLDHRVGQPVPAFAADTAVVEGHLGRRGRRLAFQVAGWLPAGPDHAATEGALDDVRV